MSRRKTDQLLELLRSSSSLPCASQSQSCGGGTSSTSTGTFLKALFGVLYIEICDKTSEVYEMLQAIVESIPNEVEKQTLLKETWKLIDKDLKPEHRCCATEEEFLRYFSRAEA